MLTEMAFSQISGLDYSDHAIAFCKEKGLPPVTKGDICDMPFGDGSQDLVLATDIVEHLDNDKKAIGEIYRVLKPGGYALLTVPMFPSLWGLQDDISLHKRRYHKKEFLDLMGTEPFEIKESFYFNFLLFAPIWLARQILKTNSGNVKSENDVNSPLLNKVLTVVFNLDTTLAPKIHPPFGVSYLCLVKKPN